MQKETFYILTKPDDKTPVVYVHLKRFIAYLEDRIKTEASLRTEFYKMALQELLAFPGIEEPIQADKLQNYEGLLEILDACLFPPLSDSSKAFWALSAPDTDYVFYSTAALYNLLFPHGESSMFAKASREEIEAFYRNLCEAQYALLLERVYHIQPHVKNEVVYVYTDKISGLPTYFSIDVDNRFVGVKPNVSLPGVDASVISGRVADINSLCELSPLLPLSAFRFEGFSIITTTDVTAKHALHKMRTAILGHKPEDPGETYRQIIDLLKTLYGESDVEFGLLPLLKLSGEIVLFYENYPYSTILNIAREQHLEKDFVLSALNEYAANPHIILRKSEEAGEAKYRTLTETLQKAGIEEYAVLPVYQNNELIGLLEAGTTRKNALTKNRLQRLELALPVLAQMMFINRTEFASAIDKVVSLNFTSIQPSVRWKFDEVAWKYLESRLETENTNTETIEAIRFENVYPLYGAIDIRNSTIEKNAALYKDMQFYFSLLLQTLLSLHNREEVIIRELTTEAEELQQQTEFVLVNNEGTTLRFIKKANDFFHHYGETHPEEAAVINDYFTAVEPATGAVSQHRRALESSMKIINATLNKHLEKMQVEYQTICPVYFDKFRTDGIEYDIYVGQSISPKQPYQASYLNRLRQVQLRSMATVVKLIHNCRQEMKLPLQTTQLIYVNANAIDISFRTDEKRFDVEGAYNTRYHIVKKRIDKVHIAGTGERLTQPGKIAIVYSQKEHAEEYKQQIIQLQQEGILEPEIEELELEELQGVMGLFALRVQVVE